MRLTYNAFRVVALAWPIATALVVIVAMLPSLDIRDGTDLVGPFALLAIVAAGTLVAYIAGIERPNEIHEFCPPETCCYKTNGAKHRKGIIR